MTRPEQDHLSSRRQWFTALARYGALAGLAILTGAAVFGRKTGDAGACDRDGVCRGCPVLSKCGLPAALSAQQVLGRWVSQSNR